MDIKVTKFDRYNYRIVSAKFKHFLCIKVRPWVIFLFLSYKSIEFVVSYCIVPSCRICPPMVCILNFLNKIDQLAECSIMRYIFGSLVNTVTSETVIIEIETQFYRTQYVYFCFKAIISEILREVAKIINS